MNSLLANIFVWACFLLQPHIALAQLSSYLFEQIDSLQKTEERNIVVFIHTDWCKFCQEMLATTFQNDGVIKILNDQFYFIDLNAEEKRSIKFHERTFKYKPTGINNGLNELAEELATIDNTISFPSLCVLNAENVIVFQHNQFMNAKDFQKILTSMR